MLLASMRTSDLQPLLVITTPRFCYRSS